MVTFSDPFYLDRHQSCGSYCADIKGVYKIDKEKCMTTIINYVTTNFTGSTPYGAISNGMATIAAVLLLGLLIEKVLLDAYEGRLIEHRTHAFMVVIAPFIIVMAVIVYLRVAQILKL
jgi:hypothetical protein